MTYLELIIIKHADGSKLVYTKSTLAYDNIRVRQEFQYRGYRGYTIKGNILNTENNTEHNNFNK